MGREPSKVYQKEAVMKKVFIGICNTQDSVPAGFFWSFIHIQNPYPVMAYRSSHPWDVVRNNVIIDKFLKSDCDILVKMDIDQAYPSDFFTRFVPLVEQCKVIGPLIYDRWPENNFSPLAFDRLSGPYPVAMDISNMSGIVDIMYPHTNLFYSRKVLEEVKPPWYEAYLSKDGLSRSNHVDFSFIDKIHFAGYATYIDLDCVVGHQFNTFVGRKFHELWARGNAKNTEEKRLQKPVCNPILNSTL